MEIRNYNPGTDYLGLKALYEDSETYGGQYDELKDSKERVDELEAAKPGSVLVAEHDDRVVGSVTLLEDGRSAWLFRFAVLNECEMTAVPALWAQAKANMKQRGHELVVVYAPANDQHFFIRYTDIGFTPGNNFTAYWQEI